MGIPPEEKDKGPNKGDILLFLPRSYDLKLSMTGICYHTEARMGPFFDSMAFSTHRGGEARSAAQYTKMTVDYSLRSSINKVEAMPAIEFLSAFPKGTTNEPVTRPKNMTLIPHVKAKGRSFTSNSVSRRTDTRFSPPYFHPRDFIEVLCENLLVLIRGGTYRRPRTGTIWRFVHFRTPSFSRHCRNESLRYRLCSHFHHRSLYRLLSRSSLLSAPCSKG